MTHIIQDFGKWKKTNEAFGDKVKEKVGIGQKVVATPIDKNNLKIKLVNDADVLDGNGKLTQTGFKGLLDWMKGEPDLLNYFVDSSSKAVLLGDLTSNIVIYSVQKDTDRKQVITFNIANKAAIGGINPQVKYVRTDELDLVKGGAVINTDEIKQIKAPAKAAFALPFSAESIPGSTDARIVDFVKNAYLKVKQEPAVSSSPIMAKVRTEVNSGKLGNASKLFIKGLNAGFNIREWSGEDIETAITQKLIDKLGLVKSPSNESKTFYLGLNAERLVEAISEEVAGFDIDAFLAAVKGSVADTGDIKVPEGGFKEGLQNDPELKKFQELLVKKLSRNLANHAVFQKFKKAGAKGFKGNYGPLTRDLVYLLKAIAENPVYPNRDGAIIEPDFVNMVQAIKESSGDFYLGLDGFTFINEQDSVFNFGNANVVSPSGGGGGGGGGDDAVKKKEVKKKEEVSSARQLEGIGFEYAVKDGFWMYRKKGSKDSWQKAANPSNIIKLQKNFSSDGGGYVRPSDLSYVYKYEGGTWKVKVGGSWQEASDSSKQELTKLYGTPGGTGAKTVSSSMSVKQIDEAHKKVANTIASWFPKEGEGPFAEFKSSGAATAFSLGIANDNEDDAWKEFKRKWNAGEGSIKVQLNKTLSAINLLPQDETKTRLKTNQDLLAGIVKDGGKFYEKFMGGTNDDNFYLKLAQSDGSDFRKTIDTDF